MAGLGQSSTANVGSLGSAAAANIGNANIAAGDARASGYTGMANAFSSGINDYGTYMGYNAAQNPGVSPVYDSGGFGSDPWGIF